MMSHRITIHVDDPSLDDGKGVVTVGWFLAEGPEATVIFSAPSRVQTTERRAEHAKSVSRCPAVLGFESRIFEIKCPIDVTASFVKNEEGRPALRVSNAKSSSIRPGKLAEMMHLVDEAEWRHPDRPIVQMALPYVFVSDAPVVINQLPPFLHYNPVAIPGIMFSGRFPIHVWPRPLVWSFEWHDLQKPLQLKRGQPLFYAQFETVPQERAIQLVEAEVTDELKEYTAMISGAVNYVGQTFSLMQTAAERRPSRLVTPKARS